MSSEWDAMETNGWFAQSIPVVAIIVGLAAAILCLPALLNGAPFLYHDSATYIAQGQAAVMQVFPTRAPAADTEILPPAREAFREMAEASGPPLVIGGRSIYYGVLAYLSQVIGIGWGLVALQGLAVAVPLVALFRILVPAIWRGAALVAAVVVGFATPGGLYVGMLMPDIWAGAMILAIAALAVLPRGTAAATRAMLTAICALAVLFHLSHLAILVALAGLGAMVWLAWRPARDAIGAGLALRLGAVVVVGLLGQAMFAYMIERTYGAPPISRPHLTAHLVDMGPGTEYARAACADGAELAICAYVDRLPTGWIAFLFDADPETGIFEIAPDPVKRQIAAEDAAFAIGTFRHAPLATGLGLARDGAAQLWHLAVDGTPLHDRDAASLEARFPPDLAAATYASINYDNRQPLLVLTRLTYLGTAASSLFLLAAGIAAVLHPGGVARQLVIAVAICVAGLVLNALVCGILASPNVRFQARVIWILPLMAVLVLTARYQYVRPIWAVLASSRPDR